MPYGIESHADIKVAKRKLVVEMRTLRIIVRKTVLKWTSNDNSWHQCKVEDVVKLGRQKHTLQVGVRSKNGC